MNDRVYNYWMLFVIEAKRYGFNFQLNHGKSMLYLKKFVLKER